MKAKRYTEEQIIAVLRESEAGAKTKELCRKYGISEPTFYNWKSKYAGMTVPLGDVQLEAAAVLGKTHSEILRLLQMVQAGLFSLA